MRGVMLAYFLQLVGLLTVLGAPEDTQNFVYSKDSAVPRFGKDVSKHQALADAFLQVPDECRFCNQEVCEKPKGCVAGIVKDNCGCCDVCGKAEFELCDFGGKLALKSSKSHGRCGDNLECRNRDDLEPGSPPEAICYCRIEGTLCGSDNETYENVCQLMAAAVIKDKQITVDHKGPCNYAPVIISPPENVKNMTGTNVAMSCEARGFPIPAIQWTWKRVDGKIFYLPSDDLHVSVNMRGGPEKWQVTGWLQIFKMKKDHEGDYTCTAQNEFGVAKATGRVNVIADEDNEKLTMRAHRSKFMNRF